MNSFLLACRRLRFLNATVLYKIALGGRFYFILSIPLGSNVLFATFVQIKIKKRIDTWKINAR